ncbi:MAG: efflux RND transporter periplasmic adaptor subunit [Burkholderiaceae bacterium]
MNTPSSFKATKLDADALALLADPVARRWWRRPVFWIAVALLMLSGFGIYFWQERQKANAAPSFVAEAVARGNLTLTVIANGTLQPTRSVSIGSELSGTVARVLVDVNDQVKKGQVLVELDTAKLSDQVVRSRAALAAANAAVAQAVATVKESHGNLARLEEVSRLSGGKVPSGAELDTGRATLERAQANALSARANVVSARATLSTDETNLSKASIRSPIDGVVLTRTVDPGNAVAASLQAVTLFTIAEDLGHMRLQVNVDEADVGSVKIGQKARFTVSAYANRNYPATITRVAFGSTITENVVTYVTYLNVDNADLSLRPGMTATATITATERRDVLLVPNTALRFTPTQSANASGAANQSGIVASIMPRGRPRTPRKSAASSSSTAAARQVWILRDGVAVAVDVTPGISDSRMTEITAGNLQAGMQVITDQRTAAQ